MKRSAFPAILTLACATFLLPSRSHAQLVISEVYSAGSSSTNYAADWFEVLNLGATSVDLTGWRVDDSSAAFATAVGLRGITSIAPGQRIIFLEGDATGTTDSTIQSSFRNAWFGGSVPVGLTLANYGGSGIGLGSGGDALNLYNAGGTLMANVAFGAATTGFTFDNSAGVNNATLTQLSAVGVNNAILSFAGGEVGSPGAIPEPATWGLLGLGALALVSLRRSRGHATERGSASRSGV